MAGNGGGVIEAEAIVEPTVLVEGGVEEGKAYVGCKACRVGSADAEGNVLVLAGLRAVAEGGGGYLEVLVGLEDMDVVAAVENDSFAHGGKHDL